MFCPDLIVYYGRLNWQYQQVVPGISGHLSVRFESWRESSARTGQGVAEDTSQQIWWAYQRISRYPQRLASVRPHTSRKGVTTYSVLYRDQGKQRSVTLTDLSRADRLSEVMGMIGVEKDLAVTFGEAEEEVDEDSLPVPTLAQYRDQHIAESMSVSSATKGNYRRYVATLRDGICAVRLDEMTRADVRRWVRGLQASGKTGKTVKNHLAFVAGVLNGAVEDGDLQKNPCHGVSVGDSSRTIQPVFLTAQQVRTIAEACGPSEGLVMWLAGTGMRWSEAMALRVSDVDVAAGTARGNAGVEAAVRGESRRRDAARAAEVEEVCAHRVRVRGPTRGHRDGARARAGRTALSVGDGYAREHRRVPVHVLGARSQEHGAAAEDPRSAAHVRVADDN